MKTFAAFLLLLAGLGCQAQTNASANAGHKKVPDQVSFFIDSLKIDVKDNRFKYIEAAELKSIDVKRSKQYPDGAVYVTLNDHDRFKKLLNDKLLSLKEIAVSKITEADKSKPIIYLLNDTLLMDTVNVSIPSMYVRTVTLVKASETVYFRSALPDVLFIKISTKAPVLYIRGRSFNGYPIPESSN